MSKNQKRKIKWDPFRELTYQLIRITKSKDWLVTNEGKAIRLRMRGIANTEGISTVRVQPGETLPEAIARTADTIDSEEAGDARMHIGRNQILMLFDQRLARRMKKEGWTLLLWQDPDYEWHINLTGPDRKSLPKEHARRIAELIRNEPHLVRFFLRSGQELSIGEAAEIVLRAHKEVERQQRQARAQTATGPNPPVGQAPGARQDPETPGRDQNPSGIR